MAASICTLVALAVLVCSVASQSCPCPKNYFPVCGSDGTTYGNPCTFRCARSNDPTLSLHHEGRCRQTRAVKKPACPCTRELRLICGTDGVTYSNPCLLKCAASVNPGLKRAHFGRCAKPIKH